MARRFSDEEETEIRDRPERRGRRSRGPVRHAGTSSLPGHGPPAMDARPVGSGTSSTPRRRLT